MKKFYTTPASQEVNLHIESTLLTGSPIKNVNKSDTEVGADASLSNQSAWNSPIWCDNED